MEIKVPREMVKPIRAMEQVMASIHGAVFHPPDWWENWVDGQVQQSVAFEIVSIEGKIHFYIRIPPSYRQAVEASVYSQYPEAEITEVEDYTRLIPRNVPNKEWDFWATDYKMLKDDHYPIKTYKQFETEHEVVEEKRIDPVAVLLEFLSKVKEGEQFWIQMIVDPIAKDWTTSFDKWMKEGEAIRDRLARRAEKSKPKPIIEEAAQILITGKPSVETKKEELIPPEMKLTPGEKEIITALESKISKPLFVTTIRFIYLGKRKTWFKGNFRMAFSFFNSYMTLNLNGLIPLGSTLTKIHKSWFLPLNWLIPRRHYMRCRKMFRRYINRFTPFFPKPGGTFILNTEELASLFHFPGKAVAPAPGAPYLETKRGEAPSELPMADYEQYL